MAREGKSGQYEMVLEQRHLLGVFFAVVVLCALFFTLGFILGRNRAEDTSATAGSPGEPPTALESAPEESAAGEPRPGTGDAAPQQQREAPPTPGARTPARTQEPAPSARRIYLQVGAFTDEVQARTLAQKLLQQGFTPVIRPPRGDRFHRVQVGPFGTTALADAAQRRLEALGYRDILRR